MCYIGTHLIYYNNLKINTNNTTLEYSQLLEILKKYNIKPKYLVMEVSSHGINQARINNLKFYVIALTNLGSDHLDYHFNINNYHSVKISFIESAYKCKYKLVNDKYSTLFKYKKNITFYNTNEKLYESINTLKYNKENIYLAYLILSKLGFKNKNILNELCYIKLNNGRGQIIRHNHRKIIIDYAHQIESFEAILNDNNYNKVVIFGCGGNRDKTKRKVMGNIAKKYCRYVIITEDNSRNEKLDDIINDISKDIQDYLIIKDRKKAIEFAFKEYPDLNIYILGKGDEDYILNNNSKINHNDINYVNELINNEL